uniref:Reverse transcriptase Ty1/copia-type domain-containing protein n=1 Tax=Fagus sylvatica TaxID=28930 RepID=A0A2N9FPQ8_FAGSY
MVCYNLRWSRTVCSMKKQEERTWARMMHKLLSQRTGGGLRVEILKGAINPEVSHGQKEKSSVSTMIKRVRIKRNCKAWKNKQKEETNQKKADDHNTTAVSLDEDVVVLSIGEDECCHVADPYDEWVIDSAASYHVTPRREFFTSYKAGNLGRDVRHIPDMRLNLISISVLDKEGYESHLGNGKWKLFKGSLVFARGKICCTLYKTQVQLFRDVHNGVAERINCTIVKKVKCMLTMAKLPKSFWAEAVQTACYLINRSPSVPLDFDIPERVWTGEDASYAHLKLWDPKKKKMIRSRDVVFHKNENIKDFEKSEKSKSTVEGVSDLTPTSSSSDIATDIEEVQVENYGDEPAGVDGDDAIDTKGVEQGEQPIPPEMEEPQVRRSTRERRPSTSEYVLITDEGESESFQELVELPKGKMALRNKWVFKLKKDGEKLVKYKARLVVKGFNQKQGIDFDEIFSPVVKMSSIQVILGLTASLDLKLKQMDVKTTFLHGDLEEEIYMLDKFWVCRFYVTGKPKKLWLSQEKYVEQVLKRFNMKHAKLVSTPLGDHFKLSKKSCPSSNKEKENMASIPYSSVVGSLIYAMVCTRPDIAHAVGVVSSSKPVLEGYTDADMAGDLDGRKSTSGFLFTFAGGAVSWQPKLQKCVTLSTTEAEYIAATEAGKEMLWMKRFLQDLGLKQDEYVVHCDSQSALDLSKNSTYHSLMKNIDVRYHWLRLIVDQQLMQLRKIHTNKNPADMLTKVVSKEKLELCAGSADMNSN